MNSVIIAIAGGTGSGKTYLTKHIAKKYSKKLLLIIDQDSYYNDISNMDFEIRCKQNMIPSGAPPHNTIWGTAPTRHANP